MARVAEVRAWRPPVAGVAEVLHATFPDHAYPLHTHDTWAVLIVDAGAVTYDLAHHAHGALRSLVTVLPPHIPHDGRSVTDAGFRKRVLYLEDGTIDPALVGRAVDGPGLDDPDLRQEIHLLHEALQHPGERFEAESRLTLVRDRVERRLASGLVPAVRRTDGRLARRLRDLLDESVTTGLTLTDAAVMLEAHPSHLVRSFSGEYGIAPHQYLTGRRLDRARRLLLAGGRPAEIAVEVGFYDQAHLTRHFKRLLGVTPGAFSRLA